MPRDAESSSGAAVGGSKKSEVCAENEAQRMHAIRQLARHLFKVALIVCVSSVIIGTRNVTSVRIGHASHLALLVRGLT